ncbi:MAG TPA: fluoride efflux transporter CrcB [Spirochaetota bacterium]|nr:fluoride efflux transporter CrcB [Spirochaetota bacterium]HOS33089.1 fluoride efflux transporter CrcB [Spirochaetota bacterium]HOS55359.1 fluoride efflux transporter CrcB [Spirochaetota bacterium]HPK61894.1 fluoride efflux transporter CrcB [Spirochaetota bacterium]HQF77870.1 fluoride efflux transporter CrcB [Spirochaetota bacterium]
MKYLYIFLGGGIGAVSRFVLSSFIYNLSGKLFPIGTLTVNLTGCFVIGFLYNIFARFTFNPDIRLFVFVGLLGGFTTFSSFGLETFEFVKQAEYGRAVANVALSNILGIILVFGGFYLSRQIFRD